MSEERDEIDDELVRNPFNPSFVSSISDLNGVETPLKFQPLEGGCPWAWAKKCEWNAYELQSEMILEAPDQVRIRLVR